MANDADERVVESNLIIEVVKLAVLDIVVVLPCIVYLGNKDDVWILLLDDGYYPTPKLEGYHFCHVAAETIDTLLSPKEEDIAHLEPCRGEREEIGTLAFEVVDAIIEFYGFVPVVA